jgi:very-short-patch-repair endonuclease
MFAAAWALARRQRGVISRLQLLDLGFSAEAIRHRIRTGRLHPVFRGVYAVGRREISQHGRWIAAVLSSGPGAMLSYDAAAALWGIGPERHGPVDISVVASVRKQPGIRIHPRRNLTSTKHENIPTTTVVDTLIDLAARHTANLVEAAINEADKQNLTDPETLRASLVDAVPRPGLRKLKRILDKATFTLTDSELERRFLPLARKAGLPKPDTQARLHGFRVDFHWPELNLVVETDGLRYHRTPAQQAKDRLRDQMLAAAGITVLRFTHDQVAHDPEHVIATLAAVRAARA